MHIMYLSPEYLELLNFILENWASLRIKNNQKEKSFFVQDQEVTDQHVATRI